MSRTKDLTVGFRVAGVGRDATKSEGALFMFGEAVAGALADYEQIANALVDIPRMIDTTINPLSGDVSSSAIDFEAHAQDALVSLLFDGGVTPTFEIAEDAPYNFDAIRLRDATGALVTTGLDGLVLWAGDEAIKINSISPNGESWDVTRAYYGTSALDLEQGTSVFARNPYTRFRRVDMLIIDRSSLEVRTVWRGFVDQIATNGTGTRIVVATSELIAPIASATINRGAVNLIEAGGSVSAAYFSSYSAITTASAVTLKGPVRRGAFVTWIQSDVGILPVRPGSGTILGDPGASTPIWDSGPELGAEPTAFDEVKAKEAWQVLIVARDQDNVPGRINEYSDTLDLATPYNPFAIALALLTSSTSSRQLAAQVHDWDIFNGSWTLGLTDKEVDFSSFEAAIARTLDLEIDRLIIGEGGEEVNLFEVIKDKLLNPFGAYFKPTVDGRLGVGFFDLPDVYDSFKTPKPVIFPKLSFSQAVRNSASVLTATVGQTPSYSGITVNYSALYGFGRDLTRRALFEDSAGLEVDFSAFGDLERAIPWIQEKARFSFLRMPFIRVDLEGYYITGEAIEIGEYIRLEDIGTAVVPGANGERLRLDDITLIGLVIGRSIDIASGTVSVTLNFPNYAIGAITYLRAPSAIASAASVGNLVAVEEDGLLDLDARGFESGDQVQVYTINGRLKSPTVYTVQSVANTAIGLDAAPSLVAGDVLRIAPVDAYNNPSRAPLNPFAYFAKGGVVEGQNTQETANIYG